MNNECEARLCTLWRNTVMDSGVSQIVYYSIGYILNQDFPTFPFSQSSSRIFLGYIDLFTKIIQETFCLALKLWKISGVLTSLFYVPFPLYRHWSIISRGCWSISRNHRGCPNCTHNLCHYPVGNCTMAKKKTHASIFCGVWWDATI